MTTLKGTKAQDPADRQVSTASADVRFGHDPGPFSEAVPGLVAVKKRITDPNPRDIDISHAELAQVDSLDKLEALANNLVEKNRAYLEAEDVTGDNLRLGTAGLRKPRFFDKMRRVLDDTRIPPADRAKARSLLARMEKAAFMNRGATFELGHLDSYHPYLDPFDDGVRALRDLVPEGRGRDSVEAVLNHIVDNKTSKGSNSIDERDAESALGLRVIDRGNAGQTVSLAAGSTDPRSPSYVVLNVAKEGLPPELQQHAGRALYRSGENTYFDKTGEAIPDALKPLVVETRATRNLGLRLMETAEFAREDFPYDWDQDGGISLDPIDISWWGHCHIKSSLQALNLNAGSKVTIFDARSGVEKTFSTSDVNDLLFALFEADQYSADVERTRFVGRRNNAVNSALPGDRLNVEVNGRPMQIRVRLQSLHDAEGNRLPVEEPFLPTKLESPDSIRFVDNPGAVTRGAWSHLDCTNRVISMKVSHQDVDENGRVVRRTNSVTIDRSKPSEAPVVLASRILPGGYPPSVVKYMLNQKEWRIEQHTFEPKKDDNGAYTMVPTTEKPLPVGDINGLSMDRELTMESVLEIHNELMRTMREGMPFVADTSSDSPVWNYGISGFDIKEVQRDGNFVKYEVRMRGGVKNWSYIVKEDDNGNPIAAHPLSAPPDFLWQPERAVAMPVFRDPDSGIVATNSAAESRRYYTRTFGAIDDDSLAFYHYATDVVYASLQDPAKETRYVVKDAKGDLYFYEDAAVYRGDVRALGGEPAEPAVAPQPS